VPLQASYTLAHRPTPLLFSSTHLPEHSPWLNAPLRWTKERSTITVRGLGSSPLILRLRYFGGPQSEASRPFSLAIGTTAFGTSASGDLRRIALLVPPDAVDTWSGDLRIELHTPPLQDAPDRRVLGIALLGLDLHQYEAPAGGPQLIGLQLALLGVLLFTILRLCAVAPGLALFASSALLALIAAAYANLLGGPVVLRPLTAQSVMVLNGCLLAALPLALLLRFTVLRAEFRIQDSGFRRSVAALTRDSSQQAKVSGGNLQSAIQQSAIDTKPWLSAICCAVLLIFVVRMVGLRHPQFSAIDHVLRINQIGQIAGGALASVRPELEQQWEWGTREPIPYALTSYYLFVPLARIWAGNELRVLVEGITVLFDASVPLLLWALLRGAPHGLRAAAFAGLCYAALPIGYLFFHDGSFPTTLGLWASLLALFALKAAYEGNKPSPRRWRGTPLPHAGEGAGVRAVVRPGNWMGWAIAIALLALALGMYVTQIAFVPFLGVALASSVALAGGQSAQLRARGLLLATIAAALIGWFVFYGEYTLPVLQRTMPALLARIGAEGSVGRSSDAFFGTAPLNAFEHLMAHFRLWPALLGLPTLIVLLSRYRDRFITHLTLAYVLLLTATLLAERWFGLWNKHVYFVSPGIALLAGLGLAWLWPRGTAGKLVCVSLIAFTFVESWLAWGNRVLWYIMPAGAL
jgi:hypothetical protein